MSELAPDTLSETLSAGNKFARMVVGVLIVKHVEV